MIELLEENRYRVKAALFVHSFSQLLLSPYSVNTSLPKDYAEMVIKVLIISTKKLTTKLKPRKGLCQKLWKDSNL